MFEEIYSPRSSVCGSPVHLRGEHAHHGGNAVDVDDVGDGLKHVEVEEGLPRHGTVQPRLHERGPVLLQHSLRPADVIFADPGHSGINNLRGDKRRLERGLRRAEEEGISVSVTKNTSGS